MAEATTQNGAVTAISPLEQKWFDGDERICTGNALFQSGKEARYKLTMDTKPGTRDFVFSEDAE